MWEGFQGEIQPLAELNKIPQHLQWFFPSIHMTTEDSWSKLSGEDCNSTRVVLLWRTRGGVF